MARIFISYRRSDSLTFTGRIYDRLVEAFGVDNVFKDVDKLLVGVDFRSVINREIGSSDVLLAIIGPGWLNAKDEDGSLRLNNPNDFVRLEIEFALRRRTMLVVPVLVSGARMPAQESLPSTIREFAFRHAAQVRDDPDFRGDIARLIEQVTRFLHQNTVTTTVPAPYVKPETPAPFVPATTEIKVGRGDQSDTTTAALTRDDYERRHDSRPRPPIPSPVPHAGTPPPPRNKDRQPTPDPTIPLRRDELETPLPVPPPQPPAGSRPKISAPQPPPMLPPVEPPAASPRPSIDLRILLAVIAILLLLAIILTLLASSP